MLSARDQDVIRRDRRLPGLELLLEPEAMVAALHRALPERRFAKARIDYLRYKPGTSCLVGYRLEIDGHETAVHAKAHRFDAPGKLRNALDKHRGESAFSPLILAPAVAVHAFPSDRKLKALFSVADDKKRERLLAKLLPGRREFRHARLHPLRYKPGRRFVARLVTAAGAEAVIKLYDDRDFPGARRGAEAFVSAQAFSLAPLLGGSSEHRVLIWRWLPGRPLDEALQDGGFEPAEAGVVGAALAELHTQGAPALKTLSRESEINALFAAANAVAFLLPELSQRAQRLATGLAAALIAAPQPRYAVHGDFSADQVLLGRGGVALLDFDNAARGDPATDLGTFAAQLERAALYGSLPAARASALSQAVLAGYRGAAGGLPPRVGLYTAAGLLRLAPHGFRNREEAWPEKTEAVLTRAEGLLDEAPPARAATRRRSGRVEVRDPFGITHDPALAFAAGALEPATIEPHLRAASNPGLELQRVRVDRHKPGKRCLITYELSSDGNVLSILGKVRAKGTDDKTLRLQETLWQRGWDDGSADGISVAEPLGSVGVFRMTLQRKVPGVSLREVLGRRGGDLGPATARRVAEVAHKLHRSGVTPPRRHDVGDELAILRARLTDLSARLPVLSARLDNLLRACERLAAHLPEAPPTCIHRDFYADQIVLAPKRLYLLDLDLCCLGDVALDLGNFTGHLTEQALRAYADPDALLEQEEALVAGYETLAGISLRPAAEAYKTLTLVRHVELSTRFRERQAYTGALLELCERRLGLVSTRAGPAAGSGGDASLSPTNPLQ